MPLDVPRRMERKSGVYLWVVVSRVEIGIQSSAGRVERKSGVYLRVVVTGIKIGHQSRHGDLLAYSGSGADLGQIRGRSVKIQIIPKIRTGQRGYLRCGD